MAYTIKQLAQYSGLTTRTLRYYDKIGLLKPAFNNESKYRYYEEEQFLLLQQILFYRALDFSLEDIQAVLSNTAFDKITSLQTHKSLLQEKIQQMNSMLKTIDKTISHLRGELTMQVEEFFDPVHLKNNVVQKEYEKYLIGKGILTQEEMETAWGKINHWTQADWDQFKSNGDQFYRKMAESIDAGFHSNDDGVQHLIHQHYLLIKPLWSFNQSSYLLLADAYLADQNFMNFCELYHSKLHPYIVEAMQYYAQHRLT